MAEGAKLVTVEVKVDAPFCGTLADHLRAAATQWAEMGGLFACSPVRRHALSYEMTQGGLLVTTRITATTATADGRKVVEAWRKAGLPIVEEEEIR